jgi:uncharacterized protein
MEFNVSHLLKSPVGTTREYDLYPGERVPLDEELVAFIEEGHLRLDRTNTGILARGHARARVHLTCARCLDPVDAHVASDFAEEFEPSVDLASGTPLPAPENELAFTLSARHILDLGEALRQNLIPALPLQALCRPECAGLCPSCGSNRNVATCDCVIVDENHPLAALADLLREGSWSFRSPGA